MERFRESVALDEPGTPAPFAILETVIAVSAAISVAFVHNVVPIAVSALLAPLLLLRTPYSAWYSLKLGLRPLINVYERTTSTILSTGSKSRAGSAGAMCVAICRLFACALIVGTVWLVFVVGGRLVGTLVALARHPRSSIGAIPQNWWRIAACTNLGSSYVAYPYLREYCAIREVALPPGLRFILEPQPTSGNATIGLNVLCTTESLRPITSLIRAAQKHRVLWKTLLAATRISIAVYALPAIMLRLSLKSTSIVYAPLVWLVYRNRALNPWERLDAMTSLAYHRVVRHFSLFVLAFFGLKLVAFSNGPHLTMPSIVATNKMLMLYLSPGTLPAWQIALAVNALLSWLMYLLGDWATYRRRQSAEAHDWGGVGQATLTALFVIRSILALFTITALLIGVLRISSRATGL